MDDMIMIIIFLSFYFEFLLLLLTRRRRMERKEARTVRLIVLVCSYMTLGRYGGHTVNSLHSQQQQKIPLLSSCCLFWCWVHTYIPYLYPR